VVISEDQLAQLQANLVRSHAAGVGKPLPLPNARMLLALRINVLAKGHSGIRPESIQTMLECLRHNCISYVPCQGTVGASGDLAPLSHLALGMMGEGKMWHPELKEYADAARVLANFKIKPLKLQAKEGLALINGTQLITCLGAEAVVRAKRIARQADVIAALTLETLKGSTTAFHPYIHQARPHRGQGLVAGRMRTLLGWNSGKSEIADSHKHCTKVQDSYTLRCIPQIHGIVQETIHFVYKVLLTEMNSATDNPMVFANANRSEVNNFPAEKAALVEQSVMNQMTLKNLLLRGLKPDLERFDATVDSPRSSVISMSQDYSPDMKGSGGGLRHEAVPNIEGLLSPESTCSHTQQAGSALQAPYSTPASATRTQALPYAGTCVTDSPEGARSTIASQLFSSASDVQEVVNQANSESNFVTSKSFVVGEGMTLVGSNSSTVDAEEEKLPPPCCDANCTALATAAGAPDPNPHVDYMAPHEGVILSGGNFHGEYPAKALDYLAIGISELASVSERRIERLVNPALSGLPAFLVNHGGLNSGFMIAHCTAAALVSENKVLTHPSSVDSLSTSAAQEDHVSMGGFAARKALDVVRHVEQVLAIELLCACQALDLLRPLHTTPALEEVYNVVRSVVKPWTEDRYMAPDIESVHRLLEEEKAWLAVKKFVEPKYHNYVPLS